MLKRKIFTLLFVLTTLSLFAQVASVDYLMKYNCESNVYEIHVVILEGSATTTPQRAQFNSQVSFVIPTGESIEIVEAYMPLQNNQNYTSTTPLVWTLGTGVISPEAQPESDFYGVTPTLSPASFYNDLTEGDIIHLFSIRIGDNNEYDDRVRFFDNEEDPNVSHPGMGNFMNGFTLGGATQLYNSNSVESCITDVQDVANFSVQSFPNPCTDHLILKSDFEIIDVKIIGIDGRIYYNTDMIYSNYLKIDTDYFPKGLYYVIVDSNEGEITNKIIKI